MNFKFITKSFSFIGWFNVLFNDESNNYNYGDCEKIINILNTENIYCMENSDGKVTELFISPSCSIERHINDLLSYNTIEELVFRSYDDDDEQCSRFKHFPNKIGNLNNLKVLYIAGGILTKEDLEEIGQLKNLKSLRIYESKYEGDDDIQNIIKNFKKLSLVISKFNNKIYIKYKKKYTIFKTKIFRYI